MSRGAAMQAAGLAAALAIATGCGSAGGPSEPKPPVETTAAPRSKVVVAVVVDQLAAWELSERLPHLPRTGGFGRLLAGASAAAELRFGHATNATAPGHAALFSGASPHDSGVTANGKLDARGAHASFVSDPSAKVVTAEGLTDRTAASSAGLLAPTVADRLREAQPDAFIVSLSMKDRGAIFGGGRRPTDVLWFDVAADAFVSSTAFENELPSWAGAFTRRGAGAGYRAPWKPLDEAFIDRHVPDRNADLGQGDFVGLGTAFPHDPAAATAPARALLATPAADRMLVDLAIVALDHARSLKRTTLLAVSLSATDYVGHVFGPDSPEAWDQLLRLDGQIARLLDHLDASFGPEGYALVLSADHGVAPTPEVMGARFCGRREPDRFERTCAKPPVRMLERDLAAAAEAAIDREIGPGNWVLGASEPFIVLTEEALSLPPDRLDRAVAHAVTALAATPGVEMALDVRRAPARCPELSDESLDALVCRSIHDRVGGDIFVVPRRGSFTDTGYVEGRGVNHGSPWLYDRAVPILARPPPSPGAARAAPRTLEGTVDQRAFARTVASMLGVPPPPFAAGGADLAARR